MMFFRVLCFSTAIAAALPALAGRDITTKENASRYYAHVDLKNSVTMGADFLGKYLPLANVTVYSDQYIFVEVALFGSPGAKVAVSRKDFTLRLNDAPLLAQPPGPITTESGQPEMGEKLEVTFDGNPPDSVAAGPSPAPSDSGSNPSGDDGSGAKPKEVNLDQLARAAELPSGTHAVPAAGYLFFKFEGKLKKIKHAELDYKGSLGEAALRLR